MRLDACMQTRREVAEEAIVEKEHFIAYSYSTNSGLLYIEEWLMQKGVKVFI